MRITKMLAMVGVFALVSGAMAEIPEGDIRIDPVGGRLVTGLISEDGSMTTPGVRVFYAEMGLDFPNFADEPGWQTPDGTFTPGAQIGFQINRALRQWNGTDFSLLAVPSLRLDFGALTATTPLTDVVTPGFNVPIDAAGGLHDHPDHTLTSSANGVFLLDLSFTIDTTGIGASDPVWVLFGQGVDDAEAQAAYDWATGNIPAPGAMALAGIAGLLAARRRR